MWGISGEVDPFELAPLPGRQSGKELDTHSTGREIISQKMNVFFSNWNFFAMWESC